MIEESLADKTILVTGGHGFLGRRVVTLLEHAGANVLTPRSSHYDLRHVWRVQCMFEDLEPQKPDMVFHLAATVGGIGATSARPADFFHDNLMMGLNIIDVCAKRGIEKLILAGSVCAYPKLIPAPFLEANLWDGEPEETNGPYGIAKRTLLAGLQAYRKQCGLNGIYLLLTNLYGPGDNFKPESSHVIPALIRRFSDAKINNKPVVTVWGSGSATRDFLYAEDAAKAFVRAAECYNEPEPINIGSGQEVSIARLVGTIQGLVGYKGDVVWDLTKPDGQPRRVLDTHAAKHHLGWQAETKLSDGLKQTVQWWQGQ